MPGTRAGRGVFSARRTTRRRPAARGGAVELDHPTRVRRHSRPAAAPGQNDARKSRARLGRLARSTRQHRGDDRGAHCRRKAAPCAAAMAVGPMKRHRGGVGAATHRVFRPSCRDRWAPTRLTAEGYANTPGRPTNTTGLGRKNTRPMGADPPALPSDECALGSRATRRDAIAAAGRFSRAAAVPGQTGRLAAPSPTSTV